MPRAGVEGHAGPVVGGAGGLPGVGGPGFVAGFAGMGDGVEGPAKLAGADVEGADVAGRSGVGFRIAAADDDEVFVDDAGGGERDGLLFEIAAEAFAEIDAAVFAEAGDWLAGGGIKAVEEVHDAGEEAALFAVGPVRHAAVGLGAGDAGVEGPLELAGGCVEGDYFFARRIGVEGAADDERVGLQAADFAGVEGPRDLELADVCAVDLGEMGVVVAGGAAVVDGPAGVLGGGYAAERGRDERGAGEDAGWVLHGFAS